MKNRYITIALWILLFLVILGACELIGGIFRLGVWTGIIIVLIVIVLIILFVNKFRNKQD